MTTAVLAAVVAASLVVRAVRIIVQDHRFDGSAEPARGEVTALREVGSGRQRHLRPVVRFALADGRVVDTEVFEARDEVPEIGDTVNLRYDPADPTRCRMSGGASQRRGAVVGLLVVAGAFLAIGVVPHLAL